MCVKGEYGTVDAAGVLLVANQNVFLTEIFETIPVRPYPQKCCWRHWTDYTSGCFHRSSQFPAHEIGLAISRTYSSRSRVSRTHEVLESLNCALEAYARAMATLALKTYA